MNNVVPTVVEQPAASPKPVFERGKLKAAGARKALAAFFVSGLLFSFPGAILPAWGHHRTWDYGVVGGYFLFTVLGVLASTWIAPPLLRRKGIGWVLTTTCALAAIALLYLAAVSPPFSPWYRMGGLLVLGLAGGTLHSAIFHGIHSIYTHDSAATVNLAGILFGTGCLVMALLVSGTFFLYTAPSIQILTAVVPALFAVLYARSRFDEHEVPVQASPRELLRDVRSPGAVLLALLVFFQFGNEWAVAGWLAVFVIQRLGISPATGLSLLALYWFSLLVGRVIAQSLLPRVSHARILFASSIAAVFGTLLLLVTNNVSGAVVGILSIGTGFAAIYPLVVEKIGHRFPDYHPGFYNGLVSLAFAGGLLAPASIGWFASAWGVRAVLGVPFAGSIAVFVLVILIWIEARMEARSSTRP